MKNLTKKRIEHGKQLVRTFGYWSEEVRLYLEKFEYNTRIKLSDKIRRAYGK